MKEIESVKKFRSVLRESQYRLLVARIATHYLKEKVGSKSDLHKEVNKVLISQQLEPVSFSVIRNNLYDKSKNISKFG
ncbi:hypothetical protein COJ91_31440 [Bacillus thuringiensis]|uniref:hypothetical protein n=1 Tax=Bacillus thuringiensis TaxID=1428 RepID=UPI000BF9A2E5|nr:hypothetical protein [Bacillus thuringiensis]PFO95830.1 hypothetical protein COJ91_31440 [Bacillus thuringiensis]PFT22403.1 hypothetical protein COK52_16725 [Bacillus thuringiensis]PGP51073.1 hypothetical protein CN992_23305 [Bacillus thuringiensis]